MLDPDLYRLDFPILKQKMRKKPFVYLDSGATSLKPNSVINAERDYYFEYGVNIHRGVYEFSDIATKKFQQSREHVARFINAGEAAEVIFTHGSTESANLVAYAWARKFLNPGDVIVATELEHHSNLVPWQAAAASRGARLEFIPYDPVNQELILDEIDRVFEGARLLVISAMSNVSSYLPPLETLIAMAHQHGLLVFVDGAQFVAHHPCDVQKLDCDFLIFSAHKMLGPTGLGVLYGKRKILESMDPFMYGGDMIQEVHKHYSSYQGIPEKFEAGTPAIAAAIAFEEALNYLERIGMDAIAEWDKLLGLYALEQAKTRGFLSCYVPANTDVWGGTLSFNLNGVHSHDVGTILDSLGVAVRTGFHCAMPLMQRLGQSGTVRASSYLYTSKHDIDMLFEGIDQAWKLFG